MNSAVKIILGFVAGSLMVCLLVGLTSWLLLGSVGAFFVRVVQSDPQQAPAIAASIAEYDLPADFGEPYAKQVAGFELVTYTGTDGHSHLTFFQLPQGVVVDISEMERQFNQASREPSRLHEPARIVEQQPVVVRAQETTLVISEGVNSDGETFRQVTAVFQGKGGQAMVVFERPLSSWDEAEVEAFIASIR